MLWEKAVGREYSKYRCVVKIGFQKKSLRKGKVIKGKNNDDDDDDDNNKRVPGPAGGSKKGWSSNHGRHTQGRKKRRPKT